MVDTGILYHKSVAKSKEQVKGSGGGDRLYGSGDGDTSEVLDFFSDDGNSSFIRRIQLQDTRLHQLWSTYQPHFQKRPPEQFFTQSEDRGRLARSRRSIEQHVA